MEALYSLHAPEADVQTRAPLLTVTFKSPLVCERLQLMCMKKAQFVFFYFAISVSVNGRRLSCSRG